MCETKEVKKDTSIWVLPREYDLTTPKRIRTV